jgi:hypothetical protein
MVNVTETGIVCQIQKESRNVTWEEFVEGSTYSHHWDGFDRPKVHHDEGRALYYRIIETEVAGWSNRCFWYISKFRGSPADAMEVSELLFTWRKKRFI